MSSQSPAQVLYSSDGYELAVVNGALVPNGTRALLISGVNPVGDALFVPTAQEGALGTVLMSNDFVVQSNVTVASSGSMLVTANYFGTQEIALIVNVAGAGTGSGSFVYTIQEIDPGNGTTLMGSPTSTVAINSGNAPGVFTAVLNVTTSPMVKVSWTLTGTLSLASVYATIVTKSTPSTQVISGSITATNLSISPVGIAPPADASYMGALANTTAPTLTNGNMYPPSLTIAGALRVDGSAVVQPITALGVAGSPTGGVMSIQGVPSGVALSVSVQGLVATGGFLPITGPVSQGNQGSIAQSWFTEITDGVHGPVAVKGPSTAAASTDPSLVVALSPNSPIPAGSNTIGSVNQAGAPWLVVGEGIAGVPTGGVMSIQGVPSGVALNVSIGSVATGALVVSGTVTSNQGTAASLAGAWPVELTDGTNVLGTVAHPVSVSGFITTNKATTSTVTSVAGSTSNTAILAANSNRITAAVYNGTNRNMYILMNSGVASTTNFSIILLTGSYWEVTNDWTGAINAVWGSGVTGSVSVTEFTP